MQFCIQSSEGGFEAATHSLSFGSGLHFSVGIAEVVGSNPIRSIFFILGKYGIELSLFWVIVGQIQQL